MMIRILIVAATAPEIQPLLDYFGPELPFDVLVTGVGMVATAFALGNNQNLKKYNLIINLGIAGSFDRDIALGQVVEITQDKLSELGAEDGDTFIPIETLGFGESVFNASATLSAYAENELKKVTAITVNTVHGREGSIAKARQAYNPQLESMEGAAFFYACKQCGVACLQIRAVSNYVEKRNRNNWMIGLAVKNLNTFAIGFISTIIKA